MKCASFEFKSGYKMASNKGMIKGFVDPKGNIFATQYFGLMNYHESYQYHVDDKIDECSFTRYLLKDRIIHHARQAIANIR